MTIRINGKVLNHVNGPVHIGHQTMNLSDGRVFMDGQDVTPQGEPLVSIEISGDVQSLVVDAADAITINGNVGSVETMSGSVKAGKILGAVSTMSGSVTADTIAGSCSSMSGKVSTRR